MTQATPSSRDLMIFYMAARNAASLPGAGLGLSHVEAEAVKQLEQEIDQRHDTWYTQSQLYISNPSLTVLTSKISHFVHLRFLNLHDCRLSALPPETGNLTLLKEIWLGNNPLPPDNVESIFYQLPALETVHLMGTDQALITMVRQKFPRLCLKITSGEEEVIDLRPKSFCWLV